LGHGCGTALHALSIGYEECEVGEVGVIGRGGCN
jgi:hypothetical protein